METETLQRRLHDLSLSIRQTHDPMNETDEGWPSRRWRGGFPTTFESPHDSSFNLVARLCEDLYGGSKQVSSNHKDDVETLNMSPIAEANSIIPLHVQSNKPYISDTLSTAVLYSNITVVVLDIKMSDAFYSYSGGDRKSWNAYRHLLEYNRENLTLLERGRCIFLPREWSFETDSVSEAISRQYVAPLYQPAKRIQFAPWNRRPDMRKPFELEALLAYEQLVLPCFPGATMNTVAAIAEKETDAFTRFNELMHRRMVGLAQANSIDVVDDVMNELQEGAAALRKQAKSLASGKLLRGSELGSFTISLATAVTGYEGQLKDVAAVIGSATLIDLLREYRERKSKRGQIRTDDYYIPYILEESGETKRGLWRA